MAPSPTLPRERGRESAADHPVTVAPARRALAAQFQAAGIDTPDLDARVLIAHALGVVPASLAAMSERELTLAQSDLIASFAARRLAHEPVAHIVGEREFWSLPLRVTPDTLIPRPETETVVEAALAELARQGDRTRPLRIADLGTGSGAILLALLSELPQAIGVGVDISTAALAVARANAERLGLAHRARFIRANFSDALMGGFDAIVSNPPYISLEELATLAPEVRDFEPRAALDGGTDGLAAYRAIAADARRILKPGGVLIVELGIGQERTVAALFAAAGLPPDGSARLDLAGVPRALVLRRQMP